MPKDDDKPLDERAARVINRSASGILTAVRRYREGGTAFGALVTDIEDYIGALLGVADPEWVEEWRAHWNRLEYVNASMIYEGRTTFADDESQLVDDALDALEAMARVP